MLKFPDTVRSRDRRVRSMAPAVIEIEAKMKNLIRSQDSFKNLSNNSDENISVYPTLDALMNVKPTDPKL